MHIPWRNFWSAFNTMYETRTILVSIWMKFEWNDVTFLQMKFLKRPPLSWKWMKCFFFSNFISLCCSAKFAKTWKDCSWHSVKHFYQKKHIHVVFINCKYFVTICIMVWANQLNCDCSFFSQDIKEYGVVMWQFYTVKLGYNKVADHETYEITLLYP